MTIWGKNGAGKVGYETVNCGSSAVCSWQAYLEKGGKGDRLLFHVLLVGKGDRLLFQVL
jgi:hypothetical protein